MSVIFILIPLSVVIATGFLLAFIWAVRSGQYEDTCTPSMRLLMPDSVADPHVAKPSGNRGEAPNLPGATEVPGTKEREPGRDHEQEHDQRAV